MACTVCVCIKLTCILSKRHYEARELYLVRYERIGTVPICSASTRLQRETSALLKEPQSSVVQVNVAALAAPACALSAIACCIKIVVVETKGRCQHHVHDAF